MLFMLRMAAALWPGWLILHAQMLRMANASCSGCLMLPGFVGRMADAAHQALAAPGPRRFRGTSSLHPTKQKEPRPFDLVERHETMCLQPDIHYTSSRGVAVQR